MGLWSGVGSRLFRTLIFPGLTLTFHMDEEGGCRVIGKVLDVLRLWGHDKFRRAGRAVYHLFVSVVFPVTVMVKMKSDGQPLPMFQTYVYLREDDIRRYFYPIVDRLTEDWKGLVEKYFGGVLEYDIPGFVTFLLNRVSHHVGGISFELEFSFPLDLHVKFFEGAGRLKDEVSVFSFYESWVCKITNYHRVVDELGDEILRHCDDVIRGLDFSGVFPLLPREAEVFFSVGEPRKVVGLCFDGVSCVYDVGGGRRYSVSSSFVEFRVDVSSDVFEGVGLRSLVEAGGDPLVVLSRLTHIVSFFPRSFNGSDYARRLFLTVVMVLLGRGDLTCR